MQNNSDNETEASNCSSLPTPTRASPKPLRPTTIKVCMEDKLRNKVRELENINQKNQENIWKLRNELRDKETHSISSADVNYWTKPRINTVTNWTDSCNELGFIYGRVLDAAKEHLEKVQIWTLIITSIDAIISFLQLAINDTDNPEYSFVFKVFLTISSVLTTVITGWAAIKRFSQKVQDYSTYIERVSNFSANAVSELSCTNDLRVNAIEYIKNNKDIYQTLMKDTPSISQKDFVTGKNHYLDYVSSGKCNHYKLFGQTNMKKSVESARMIDQDLDILVHEQKIQ